METPAGPVVDAAWLERRLGQPGVVVLDATVHLDAPHDPALPYVVRSGRQGYDLAHLPGARFADIPGVLSDPAAPLPLTVPSPAVFADGMGRLGVADETLVVAYDRDAGMWAARLWWMCRLFGHDRVAVLDGGLRGWRTGGRSVTSAPAAPAVRGVFTPCLRPALVAGRDDVLAAVGDVGTLLVNALAAEAHRGETDRYGRPGRIPGSVNVPARSLLGADGRLRAAPELHAVLADAGALTAPRVIAYCGGGISATIDVLALAVLGRSDVAVYDGSLREWAGDPSLPLECG